MCAKQMGKGIQGERTSAAAEDAEEPPAAYLLACTTPDAAATPRKPLEDAKLAVVPRAMLTYEADQQLQHFACGAVINLAATSSAMRRARVPPRPLLRPLFSLRKPPLLY